MRVESWRGRKGKVGKERKQQQGDMLMTERSPPDKKMLLATGSPGQACIEPTMAQNSLPIFCIPLAKVHPWKFPALLGISASLYGELLEGPTL